MAGVVYVNVYPVVGRPEPGVWCDRCLLPSAFEATVHGLMESPTGRGTPTVWPLGRIRACHDCGQMTRVG